MRVYDNRPKQGPDDRESNSTFLENHIHSLIDLSIRCHSISPLQSRPSLLFFSV